MEIGEWVSGLLNCDLADNHVEIDLFNRGDETIHYSTYDHFRLKGGDATNIWSGTLGDLWKEVGEIRFLSFTRKKGYLLIEIRFDFEAKFITTEFRIEAHRNIMAP